MKEIGRLLREGDPVARESFPATEVDGMLGRLRFEAERGMLEAQIERVPWGTGWRVIVTTFACVAGVLVAVSASRELPVDRALGVPQGTEPARVQPLARPVTAVVPVRQLQFSTPEGVRVFWTFDPDFQEN